MGWPVMKNGTGLTRISATHTQTHTQEQVSINYIGMDNLAKVNMFFFRLDDYPQF